MLDLSSKNLSRSILFTLAYSDVFDYPLTAPEVYRYLINQPGSMAAVMQALDGMVMSHSIAHLDGYFSLPNRESIVETRKRRADIASRLWKKAVRYGQVLAALPFVRMVAVTGSLAMNNTEEGKDIDFMLITAPGWLWTCRALSLLVARFAGLGGVVLCPNYLVTTNALLLNDQSLYVAHELAQMIPLSGMDVYDELRRLNAWTDHYLPNAHGAPDVHLHRHGRDSSVVEKGKLRETYPNVFEFIFKILPIHLFERWEMDRKIKRLSTEQGLNPEASFSADVCKGHVDRHGQNTAQAIENKLKQIALVF